MDPETFDAQWNYGRTLPRTDVAREIEDAIASATVYDRVAALKPTHRLYTRLKQELLRLRESEKKGGWGALPAGPALKPGDRDARVQSLRSRLVRSGDFSDSPAGDPLLYDDALAAAVKLYQQRYGLEPDGVIGEGTVAELNVPVAERITQLRVNLDRGRVLLHDLPDQFIVVNIAGYTLYHVKGQQVAWSTRVQVGKTYRRTPLFRSEITYLVFNPTWTVPPGIIKADILPAARKDPQAITRKGLKVLDANGRVIDPASVDWSRFQSGHIPYTLRQDPGPSNALGRVKLMFPNPYLVYLHDTPSQSLFERADRAFSSGCVRVERALELAERCAQRCTALESGLDRTGDRLRAIAECDVETAGSGAARLLDILGGLRRRHQLPSRCLRPGRQVGRRPECAVCHPGAAVVYRQVSAIPGASVGGHVATSEGPGNGTGIRLPLFQFGYSGDPPWVPE